MKSDNLKEEFAGTSERSDPLPVLPPKWGRRIECQVETRGHRFESRNLVVVTIRGPHKKLRDSCVRSVYRLI